MKLLQMEMKSELLKPEDEKKSTTAATVVQGGIVFVYGAPSSGKSTLISQITQNTTFVSIHISPEPQVSCSCSSLLFVCCPFVCFLVLLFLFTGNKNKLDG
jgi:hypothetical protein